MKRVLAAQLESEFSDIEPFIDKFCKKWPEYDKLEMIQEVLQGNAILWAGDDYFLYGSPIFYPNLKVFMIEAMGGLNLEDNIADSRLIEEEVKAWGFDVVQACCRKGLVPLMKGQGYSERSIVMQKRLNNERKAERTKH